MSANFLSLSGWGQPAYSLDEALSLEGRAFDYLAHSPSPKLLTEFRLSHQGRVQLMMGWSLGGQVALQLAKELKPKLLVLIAASIKFVNDKNYKLGVTPETFETFITSFKQNPDATLEKFKFLIAQNDKHEKSILKQLNGIKTKYSGAWLEQLGQNDFLDYDFSGFPKTLIIQGKQDQLVNYKQAELLHDKIAGSKLILLDDAAHAPHLHAPDKIKKLIENEL